MNDCSLSILKIVAMQFIFVKQAIGKMSLEYLTIDHMPSFKNQRNPRRRKAGNGRRQRARRNPRQNQKIRLTQIGRFMPNEYTVNLRYNDTTLSRTVSGSAAMNWSYRSSAFDPDPAVLTGSIPGFVELANMYASYRINYFTARINCSNQNAQAVILTTWPSNVGQGVNSLSASDIMEYSGNPNSQTRMMGPSNGFSNATIFTVARGRSLTSNYFKTDLNYASDTSTNPVSMFHINIGCVNTIGNFTFPVATNISLVYNITFFNIRQLET